MPDGSSTGAGPVSGPAVKAPAPRCQMMSAQVSGSTSVGLPEPVTDVHRQLTAGRSAAGGAHSRYPGRSSTSSVCQPVSVMQDTSYSGITA